MTIRLSVQRERWWHHVTDVALDIERLVPVVKGNGYGFGRSVLASLAVKLNQVIAVGTVHELDGLPPEAIPVVLTPTLSRPHSDIPILTVGAPEHVEALRGWGGRVLVKLTSSMHRYGRDLELVSLAQRAGLRTVGVSIHPPIEGDDDRHRADIDAWLDKVDPSLDVWVSHLSPATFAALPATHRFHLRSGTYLWLGDRGALHLQANVLDARPVRRGEPIGYRLTPAPSDGTLVMIGAGTANGVTPINDDKSPFHFQQRRLDLVEFPHMHTSMVLVPANQPSPPIGEWVDLQRPLTMTAIDELRWV